MKVVIPVAGLGTRMLPATKAIPKEMLTVFDRPMIQYIVEECAYAGISEIILVTHSSKNCIENHFDTAFELEHTLEKRVKRQILEEVRGITPPGVTIISVRQGVALGLGHAIGCARPVIGDSPFAVILPDVILAHYSADQKEHNLAAMIKRFNETGKSQIMVSPVPKEDVVNYGIASIKEPDELLNSGHTKIINIVEKPSINKAPSNLAVVGRYVFDKSIWPLIEKTPLGVGGEIQLTDAIDLLIAKKDVEAYLLKGKTFDCGSKEGYFEAFVEYALRNEKHSNTIKSILKSIVSSHKIEASESDQESVQEIYTK